jgi:hypothetical protein
MSDEKPTLLRADELAELLRLAGPDSARIWAKHHIPGSIVRVGGLIRYRRDRIEPLLEPVNPSVPPVRLDKQPAPPVEEGAR